MSLPDKIRYDSIMVAFMKPTPEDLAVAPSNGVSPRSSKPERPAPPSFVSSKYVHLAAAHSRHIYILTGDCYRFVVNLA